MSDPRLILFKFLETGAIPHALLFTGRDLALKTDAALDFVKALIPGDALPFDFAHISDSPLAIDKVRELKHNFAEGPLAGPHKIAFIAKAEDMRLDAANTFLKFLEEPPRRSLLILMAPTRSSILPTIASRTLEVRFPGISKFNPKTAAYEDVLNIFESANLQNKFREAQKYNLKNKAELLNILDAWLIRMRAMLNLGEKVSIYFVKKILQVKKIIVSTNANPQLLLEELFINSL